MHFSSHRIVLEIFRNSCPTSHHPCHSRGMTRSPPCSQTDYAAGWRYASFDKGRDAGPRTVPDDGKYPRLTLNSVRNLPFPPSEILALRRGGGALTLVGVVTILAAGAASALSRAVFAPLRQSFGLPPRLKARIDTPHLTRNSVRNPPFLEAVILRKQGSIIPPFFIIANRPALA